MKLAKNLRMYREKRGLSQYSLGKKTGIPNSTILRLENGEMKNPTLRILLKLSKELNVTIDELIRD